MKKLLSWLILAYSLIVSCSVLAQYKTIDIDVQDGGKQVVIDRVFTGNTIGLRANFYDGTTPLAVTNWNMTFRYGYGQYDTNGMVPVAGTNASSNSVVFESATNIFFSESDGYYFSIVGTNSSGAVRTFARGTLIEEYDPATGGAGGYPLPMPWGSYQFMTAAGVAAMIATSEFDVVVAYGTTSDTAYRGDQGNAVSSRVWQAWGTASNAYNAATGAQASATSASNLAASAYAAATNAGTNATAALGLTLAQTALNGGFAGTESIGPLRITSYFYGAEAGIGGGESNEFNIFAGDYCANNVTGSYNTAVGAFSMRDTIGHPHGVTMLGTHCGEKFNFGTNSGGTVGAGAHALHYSAGKDLTGVGDYALYSSTGEFSCAFGYYAGGYTISTGAVMAGFLAGAYSAGNYYSALGASAGYGSTGNYWSALGGGAGQYAIGNSWHASGRGSGYASIGDEWSAFARYSGMFAIWTNSVAIGYRSGWGARGENRMYIGNLASAAVPDVNDALYSPTNIEIFVDNGAVSLGRGGSYSNMLPQTNNLRGVWMVGTNQLPGIDWAGLAGDGGGISLADATNVAEAVVGAATTNDMPGIDWGSLGGGAGTITGATVAEGSPLAVTTNAGVLTFTIPAAGGEGGTNIYYIDCTALGDPYVLAGTNVVFSYTNNWVQSWMATSAASQISFAVKTNAAQRIGALLDITATTFPITWLTASPPVRVVGNVPSNAVSSWRISSPAGTTNYFVDRMR